MAKTHTVPAPAATVGRGRPRLANATDKPVVVDVPVSRKTRTLIDNIRDEFDAFTGGFAQITADRAALAPKFMKAFKAWATETGEGLATFTRIFDPTVPVDRDGYRAHKAYQAADYLRRLDTQGGREVDEVAEEDRPVPVYKALAYLIATVMPSVDPTGVIWAAFVKEMNWTEEQATRIKVMSAKLGAVKLPPATTHRLRRTGTEG